MAVVAISEVQKYLTSALNSGTVGAWGTTLDDDRRSAGELQHAAVSGDADVIWLMLKSFHPLVSGLMAPSADLVYDPTTNSAPEIPDSIGEYGPVEIKIASGDTVYVTGTPASVDDIELIRRNPNNMFGVAHNVAGSPMGGYFAIRRPKIHFTGYAARLYVGNFTPNYATPACQSPEQMLPAVEIAAHRRLFKEGDTSEGFQRVERLWEMYVSMITSGAEVIPPVEQVQKAVG